MAAGRCSRAACHVPACARRSSCATSPPWCVPELCPCHQSQNLETPLTPDSRRGFEQAAAEERRLAGCHRQSAGSNCNDTPVCESLYVIDDRCCAAGAAGPVQAGPAGGAALPDAGGPGGAARRAAPHQPHPGRPPGPASAPAQFRRCVFSSSESLPVAFFVACPAVFQLRCNVGACPGRWHASASARCHMQVC